MLFGEFVLFRKHACTYSGLLDDILCFFSYICSKKERMESLKQRRTIRKYQQKDISSDLLNDLLETSFRASTVGNMQVYSVIVTRDADRKARLAPAHYARNHSHQGKILQALMCGAILTYRNTAVSCSDLYIQLRISDGVTNLLISTSCCKHCKSTCKGNLTCGSDSCCNTHHVALCDTAVNVTLREFFFQTYLSV